jgi:hypothetical protein
MENIKYKMQRIFTNMDINKIPENNFKYGFDSFMDDLDHYPSLVIATTDLSTIKNQDGWFLAYNDCGGFSCDTKKAAVYPLNIRLGIINELLSIAEEDFTKGESLDHYNLMGKVDKQKIINGYLHRVSSLGLTCSSNSLELLTQALYPLDMTKENLAILSSDKIDDINTDGCWNIYIVGDNCD